MAGEVRAALYRTNSSLHPVHSFRLLPTFISPLSMFPPPSIQTPCLLCSPLPSSGSSRFPPASYHPSLSSLYAASDSQLPWPAHHTSSTCEDIKSHINPQSPSQDNSKAKAIDKDMPPTQSRDRHHQEPSKDTDEGMPTTSNFVNKLYK